MLTLEKLLSGDQVIVLDGALGTELLRRRVELSLPLWSAAALGTAPETVGHIHREYRAAGANTDSNDPIGAGGTSDDGCDPSLADVGPVSTGGSNRS